MVEAGNAHLNSEGEVSVRLTSLYLLVRNQLFQDKLIIFHFQNNLFLTSKDKEVRTDTSPSELRFAVLILPPFRIKVSVPWLGPNGHSCFRRLICRAHPESFTQAWPV